MQNGTRGDTGSLLRWAPSSLLPLPFPPLLSHSWPPQRCRGLDVRRRVQQVPSARTVLCTRTVQQFGLPQLALQRLALCLDHSSAPLTALLLSSSSSSRFFLNRLMNATKRAPSACAQRDSACAQRDSACAGDCARCRRPAQLRLQTGGGAGRPKFNTYT